MKKYTSDYFERKYKILFDKLLLKEGFEDEIKKTRKELGIPLDGFSNIQELIYFIIKKMSKKEQQELTMLAFANVYEYENRKTITEENEKEFIETFTKKFKKDKGIGMIPMMYELSNVMERHHYLFTNYPLFEKNKYLSKLLPFTLKIMNKFYGIDLLDENIIVHYIEKYLFLGKRGVEGYIRNKVSCHNCKYLGIEHFSPIRSNMEGQDEGPFSEKYIFNKNTVKMLSKYFNSVFIIIKPYATKEMTIQYIEDNWEDLKEHITEKNTFYKQFDVKPSIIKSSDDEKNKLVYELYKLSKKELLKIYKGTKDFSLSGIYKESIISAILEEEHNIKMTADAIKKSATRYSKSTKIKNEPKDIRDI